MIRHIFKSNQNRNRYITNREHWLLIIILCVGVSLSVAFNAAPKPSERSSAANTPTSTPTPPARSFSLSTLDRVKPKDILLEVSYVTGGGGMEDCRNGPSGLFIPYVSGNTVVLKTELMQTAAILICGWKPNERVQVTITKPNNEIITDQILSSPDPMSNIFMTSYEFTPPLSYPVGKYRIEFRGTSGQMNAVVNVQQPGKAHLYWLDQKRLLFYKFRPNERVRLLAYKQINSPDSTWHFVGLQELQVNNLGELIVSDDLGADSYIAVGASSGNVPISNPSKKWPNRSSGIANATIANSKTYYCFNSPPTSRIAVGMQARVTFTDGRPLNVRSFPRTSYVVTTKLREGTTFKVTEGPVCNQDMYWWRIDYGYGSGYVAEGDAKSYFIEPVR